MFSRPQECTYCRAPIAAGERWVREKIYESAPFLLVDLEVKRSKTCAPFHLERGAASLMFPE
jgi:hypothetical protein